MSGHAQHATPKVYLTVYVLLVILLFVTVGLYYAHLGPAGSIIAAMIVAITKAVLVVLFFMQVYYGTKLTWVWAALGFIWVLLLTGIIADYATRNFRSQDGMDFSPSIVLSLPYSGPR